METRLCLAIVSLWNCLSRPYLSALGPQQGRFTSVHMLNRVSSLCSAIAEMWLQVSAVLLMSKPLGIWTLC